MNLHIHQYFHTKLIIYLTILTINLRLPKAFAVAGHDLPVEFMSYQSVLLDKQDGIPVIVSVA